MPIDKYYLKNDFVNTNIELSNLDNSIETQIQNIIKSTKRELCNSNRRVDLTKLKTYTIDSQETEDLDDAISIDLSKRDPVIWIHIADVASLISVNSPIDLEARKRFSTLYLAESIRPMLPDVIVQNHLSLKSKTICPALSASVTLNEYGDITSNSLTYSWIKPNYQLTYEEAEELIELEPIEEAELSILSKMLVHRTDWRVRRGAVVLEQPQGKFLIENQKATIKITEPSKSRRMISEAMILMGSVVAQFASDNDLFIPYRAQAKTNLPSNEELSKLEYGPVRNAAIKKRLRKGVICTKPKEHFSLGLDKYVQVTSPIRRYTDLLTHHQILLVKNNKQPLNENEIDQILRETDKSSRNAISICNQNREDCLQKWLKDNEGTTLNGLFLIWLRADYNIALIHITEIAMDLPMKLKSNENIKNGSKVKIRIKNTNTNENQFTLIAFE